MDSPLMRYRTPLVIFLVVVTGLLGAAFLYTAIPQYRLWVDQTVYGVVPRHNADWSSLDGTMVLSLARANVSEDPSIHTVQLGIKQLEPYSVQRPVYFAPAFSPDGAYVALTVPRENAHTLVVRPNDEAGDEAVTVSTGAMRTVLMPSWSHDGNHVVFMARTNADVDDRSVESWGVYVADPFLAASARHLTDGMYPAFAHDGSVLVMRRDGLYRFVFEKGEWTSVRVLEIKEGSAAPNMQFDLSHDGEMLAWTNPEKGTLDVFTIENRNGAFEIRKTDEFPITAFSPVISPNSKFIGLEVVESIDAPIGQRLAVLDLSTGDVANISELASYAHHATRIIDWIAGDGRLVCDCEAGTPSEGVLIPVIMKSKQGAGTIGNFGGDEPPLRTLADADSPFSYRTPSLSATPLRVRSGSEAVIGWNTGNRDLCSLRSTDGHRIPERPLFSLDRVSWLLNPLESQGYLPRIGTAAVSIGKETAFVLECNDPGRTGAEIGTISKTIVIRTLPSR